MNLTPAPDCFGYDGFEIVTTAPLRKEFLASLGRVPPSGDWLNKTYRYQVTLAVNGVNGALQAAWEPRKWIRDTYPYMVRFNPSRVSYGGWQTWDCLYRHVLTWVSNARLRRLDTKVDFHNTLADVLSSVYLKGAKTVFIDPRYPRTIYIGEMGGVQLVIYDKGLQLWGIPDVLTRVEIRQWFETDASAEKCRPYMMEFMRGDLLDHHPFKNVGWIDPQRLDPQVREVAQQRSLNAALLAEIKGPDATVIATGISPTLRMKTRRQSWNHGSDDIYRLYLAGAEPWHQDFIRGREYARIATAAAHSTAESPYTGMTLEAILGMGAAPTTA